MLFTLFAFIAYFNMLNIGQRWVSTGQINWLLMLLLMHGSVFAACALWLAKRHNNIQWRSLLRRSSGNSTPMPS